MAQDARTRVLVLPSWYPSAENPIAGSFFQEQAALLSTRFDVQVLYGYGKPRGRKGLLWRLLLRPFRGWSLMRRFRLANGPNALSLALFEYSYLSTGENGEIAAARRTYRDAFRRLLTVGSRPDVIHAHSSELAGIIAADLAREFDIPFVLTEHNIFTLSFYSTMRQQLVAGAVNGARELVAVSQHQLRCIFLHGLIRPAKVVGNLVDEELFALAPRRGKGEVFTILTVTYPSPIKDCGTFFKAIGIMVAAGHDDIQVVVVGTDSFKDLSQASVAKYERLAADSQVAHVCRFVPHVARADMPTLFANCDVFVSSSLAETFGLAVREAMAVGRPVVTTASGGVDDIMSDANGIKVDIQDADAMAAALISIKTGERRFDGETVRATVVQRHGRAAFLAQMSAVYESALAQAGPAAEGAGVK